MQAPGRGGEVLSDEGTPPLPGAACFYAGIFFAEGPACLNADLFSAAGSVKVTAP